MCVPIRFGEKYCELIFFAVGLWLEIEDCRTRYTKWRGVIARQREEWGDVRNLQGLYRFAVDLLRTNLKSLCCDGWQLIFRAGRMDARCFEANWSCELVAKFTNQRTVNVLCFCSARESPRDGEHIWLQARVISNFILYSDQRILYEIIKDAR